MRILMIGLGQIACKAYLPVLGSRAEVELHLVTRDRSQLTSIGAAYRIPYLYGDLEEALDTACFDAAFVHAATPAHPAIVARLLREGIAVFVDKPLADNFDQAARLVEMAERTQLPLMVGFNRRYARAYADLPAGAHDTLLMYKHRRQQAAPPRPTVFDDFIHVVDSLRFLSPAANPQIAIETTIREGKLQAIILLLSSPQHKAIGMMNREAGLDEERLEIIGRGARRAVLNLSDSIDYEGAEIRSRRDDWSAVALQRGFEAMCADFLDAVRERRRVASFDILETHRICELIVQHAEGNDTSPDVRNRAGSIWQRS